MAQDWNRGRGNNDDDDRDRDDDDHRRRGYRRFKTIVKKRPFWSPFSTYSYRTFYIPPVPYYYPAAPSYYPGAPVQNPAIPSPYPFRAYAGFDDIGAALGGAFEATMHKGWEVQDLYAKRMAAQNAEVAAGNVRAGLPPNATPIDAVSHIINHGDKNLDIPSKSPSGCDNCTGTGPMTWGCEIMKWGCEGQNKLSDLGGYLPIILAAGAGVVGLVLVLTLVKK